MRIQDLKEKRSNEIERTRRNLSRKVKSFVTVLLEENPDLRGRVDRREFEDILRANINEWFDREKRRDRIMYDVILGSLDRKTKRKFKSYYELKKTLAEKLVNRDYRVITSESETFERDLLEIIGNNERSCLSTIEPQVDLPRKKIIGYLDDLSERGLISKKYLPEDSRLDDLNSYEYILTTIGKLFLSHEFSETSETPD